MRKILVAFKTTKEFKEFLQAQAQKENRTLSGFIINALLIYIKEHLGIDYKTPPKPSK